jgi:hypothetical protein
MEFRYLHVRGHSSVKCKSEYLPKQTAIAQLLQKTTIYFKYQLFRELTSGELLIEQAMRKKIIMYILKLPLKIVTEELRCLSYLPPVSSATF